MPFDDVDSTRRLGAFSPLKETSLDERDTYCSVERYVGPIALCSIVDDLGEVVPKIKKRWRYCSTDKEIVDRVSKPGLPFFFC